MDPPRRRWTSLLVLLIVALGVARYVPFWDEPWGTSVGAINGAWYAGEPVRAWERFGFCATRGLPLLTALPTTPPGGDPYTHHPPLFPWTVYACVSCLGWSERAFRFFPSIAAALSGGLIVLLAARRRGPWLAAASGLLWLVLPMSFLYGLMCQPESATLFFILLTIVLHDRLRTARFAWYTLALVAQFLAGQMDWQGHFAIPVLLLWELRLPRGDRRLGRVIILGAASVFSAFVVITIHGFFVSTAGRAYEMVTRGIAGTTPGFDVLSIPEYLVRGIQNALVTAEGSVQAETQTTFGGWFAIQGRNLFDMFTWPAVVVVAVALVWAFFQRTEALLLGLVLLLPGVLNIVVFRLHAAHEFWLYYSVPGFALVIPEILRLLFRRRILAVLVTASIVAFSVYRVDERLAAWHTTDFRDAGRELDGLVDGDDDVVLCDVRFSMITFYMHHWTLARSLSIATLQEIYELKQKGRIRKPLVFVVAAYEHKPWPEDLDSVLARYGRVRRLGRDEVLARLPALARTVTPGPLWLVRVE